MKKKKIKPVKKKKTVQKKKPVQKLKTVRQIANRKMKTTMKSDLKIFLDRAAKKEVVSVDTETTGLTKSDDAFCISMTFQVQKDMYSSAAFLDKEIIKHKVALKKILDSKNIRKVFHNARFDIYYLNKLGFNIDFGSTDDTMIIAHLLHSEGSKKLKELGKKWIDSKAGDLKDELDKEMEEKNLKNYKDLDPDLLKKYAMQDTLLTLKVYNYFISELETMPDSRRDQLRLLYKLELETLKVLYEIETTGLLLDKTCINRLKQKFVVERQRYLVKLQGLAKQYLKIDSISEFNANSDKDILALVEATGFNMVLIPEAKTGKSLQKKYLEDLIQYDKTGVLENITKYRHYKSMIAMYLDNFLKGEKVTPSRLRLYPKFSQTVAVTGRFSSFNPNFQNIQRGPEIRQVIVAPPGKVLVSFDYKQIEVRVLAHCSKDFKLISIFLEGKDIYTSTGTILWKTPEDQINEDRRFICKKIILGVMYGMGTKTLSKVAKVPMNEAGQFIESFYGHFRSVQRYRWNVTKFARDKGYVLNIYGRKRLLGERESYKGVNTIIQGSTADIMRYKMVTVDHQLRKEKLIDKAHLILQSHDELVYEVDKKDPGQMIKFIEPILIDPAIGIGNFSVPLAVDIEVGNDWGNQDKWKGGEKK